MALKTIKKPYLYVGTVNLAANAVGQIIFQITSDYDYYETAFSYNATTAVANEIPYFSLQHQSNEDRIFSDWIPSRVFAGMNTETNPAPDLRYPVGLANWFSFDCPYKFPARSTMVWNLRNDIAQIIAVTLTIKGFRAYTVG